MPFENDPARQACFSRAAACMALGDVALHPAVPDEVRTPEALALYRTACLWLIRCKAGPDCAIEQLAQAPEAASHKEALSRGVFEDATLDDFRLQADAQALQGLCTKLRSELESPLLERRAARRRVWLRRLAVLTAVSAVLGFGGLGARRAWIGPNLAAGKPWRTSSAFDCHPEIHTCAGGANDLFFHTREDGSPWIELDLLAPTKFRSIEVANRRDCCEEKATPLVVEVSDDQKRWTEVARREEVFTDWLARFKPVTARYVRLRVARRSMLHLEGISIRK